MTDSAFTPSAATREDVVRAAYSWVDTPFQDCCDVKGAGVDCAMLTVRVFVDLGLVPPIDPRPYAPEWFLHNDESLFIQWLDRYARRVKTAEAGDVAVLKFGRHPAHGAIITGQCEMVHAFKPARRVIKDSRRGLAHRVDSFWSVFA